MAIVRRLVAELIDRDELGFERPLSLSGTQGIDCVDGVGKKDAVAVLAGSVAESRSQMGFAEAAQT